MSLIEVMSTDVAIEGGAITHGNVRYCFGQLSSGLVLIVGRLAYWNNLSKNKSTIPIRMNRVKLQVEFGCHAREAVIYTIENEGDLVNAFWDYAGDGASNSFLPSQECKVIKRMVDGETVYMGGTYDVESVYVQIIEKVMV